MRSPADASRARVLAEQALRLAALAALVVALWRTTGPRDATPPAREMEPADAAVATLADSTRPGDTLRLRLAAAPPPMLRAQLAALVGAGRAIAWRDEGVPAIAASVEPARAPGAAPRLDVVAPRGAALVLGDAAGRLDSVTARDGGASLSARGTSGALFARAGAGTRALAAARDSLALRRVLVIGRAGWEAKFTIAALEEAGWAVDAALDVAPGTRVSQGDAATPDTARHAAVVALDSAAGSRAAAIVRYVRAGGGLVIAGEAARLGALAPVRAGRSGARLPGLAGAIAGAAPRRGLALHPVGVDADAVPLERRDALVAVAARRVEGGRVLQVGYHETWRWRMEGDDAAPEAHRRWWSTAVASVAHAPVVSRARVDTLDPAPRAALVSALGPPTATARTAAGPARPWRTPDSLLCAVAMLALLAEWASRRLRGAR